MILKIILLFIFSFLIGGIPTGYIIVKVFKKKDIRQFGSGNIGFANVLRTAGVLMGVVVLLIDTGKAYLATYYFSNFLEPVTLYRLIFGLTVILGNIFNPFLKFKGGKGVAAGLGVALTISPIGVIFSIIMFLIILMIFRYMSLGSITAVATFLICNIVFYFIGKVDIYAVIFSIILFISISLRHNSNIKRLIKGEENKIGKRG